MLKPDLSAIYLRSAQLCFQGKCQRVGSALYKAVHEVHGINHYTAYQLSYNTLLRYYGPVHFDYIGGYSKMWLSLEDRMCLVMIFLFMHAISESTV
jgi:hypothetical protein